MKSAIVATEFDVAGRLVNVQPTGSGNVNDTYMAVFRTHFSEERFILQKINSNVFPNPVQVMENMRTITEHVHRRLEETDEDADRVWQLPRIIPTRNGQDYLLDEEGEYWRAITLIASAKTHDCPQSVEHAHEAGTVLGHFQRMISDIPVGTLHDTLVGFHVTPSYLEKYDKAFATELGQRRALVSTSSRFCKRFIERRGGWCSVLEDARESGELQLRPIHGDPKISNIMIDDFTGKGTCIIDLDTVKPGLIQYDFGDCMRSCCNPGGEETQDLTEIYFDTDLCEAIISGYMSHADEFLTEADRHYLFDSIRLITFELGIRFFTDYLEGDVYFKTQYDSQNLNRARAQFRLCESIETRESQIRRALDRR
ncbi:MAG: aminoglycoside phosphotransferase family protein [Lentisphaeria bacterium]|nr:aminoglycoside phosphotransferase family protein [Lentisphaeria bacterium]